MRLRKILAMLLVVCMVFGTMGTAVFAQENEAAAVAESKSCYLEGDTLYVYQGKITKGELYNVLAAKYGEGTYKYGTSKPTLSWALGGTEVKSGQTDNIALSGGTLYVGKKKSTFSWTDYTFTVQTYGYSANFPTVEKATVHMDGNVQAGEQHVTLKAAIIAGAVKDWGDYAGITPTVYAYDDGTLSTGWHKLEWFIDSAMTSGIYPATASRPIKFEWPASGDLPAYTVEAPIVFSDHNRTSNPVVTAPTCTEKGYTTYTCDCGLFTCTGAETAELGHTAGAPATCTTAQTCTVCGDEMVAALDHNWLPATDDNPKTCSVCGETEGEALVKTVRTEEEFVAALAAGGVVKLGANIYTTTTATTATMAIGDDEAGEERDPYTYIMTGEDTVLDLNGYEVTPAVYPYGDDETYYLLICGDLTITDNSEDGNGKIHADEGGHLSAEETYVEGVGWTDAPTITIQGGTVENLAVGDGVSVIVEGGNADLDLYPPDYFYEEEEYEDYLASLKFSGVTAEDLNLPEGYELSDNGDGTLGIVATPVVKIGDVGYASLEEAVAAAQNGDEIVILADIVLGGAVVVPADKNIALDLNGYTITYNSTNQGEAMITNKGTLTINDSVGSGVINYNYTGAADSSYGKGNYTISNAGTLTVNGGTITIANLSGHAKYPIDNNSTTGDAILVINGGHLYNYNTSAIRQFCNSITNQNSVTINGGLIEGYCAIWVQNPGSNIVHSSLAITGGEIKSTAKAYVNGTAELKDVSSAIYYTIAGNGGAWSEDSSVAITGGTINENVSLATEAPATINVNESVCYGRVELPVIAVAKIGDVEYTSLQDAIDAAVDGDIITLLADTAGDVTVAADDNLVLDLNGFDIVGEMTGITNNGTLIINDSVGTGNVYTFDVSAQGRATIQNYGNITINGGWFGDSNNDTSDRNAINRGNAVKNYGTAVINGGYFTNVSNQYIGTDAYAYAINTLTSGTTIINNATVYGDINGLIYSDGTTIIKDGSYILGRPNEENNLWYLAYGNVEIHGGTWTRAFKVPSWNTADPTFNGNVKASGGIFNVNIEAYVAQGYAAIKNLNGNYVVGTKPTAEVNNLGMQTVPAGNYMVYGGGSTAEDMPLSFVMQFVADQSEEDMATSPYAEWYGDFVITFTGIEDGSFIADGCYLAGHYGSFGWVKVPVDGMKIEEGERYPVMLGVGMGQKYDYICSSVQDFKCALYLTEDILKTNPNIQVNLELAVVDNSKGEDAAASALVSGENIYKVTDYNYTAEDFVVESYVAQIGDDKYTSLEEAIAAAVDGDTVTVLTDIELSDTLTIPSGKVVILDLNGKTISGVCNASQGHLIMVSYGADLTIKDSSTEQTGKITYAQGTSSVGWTIDVEGDFVLESGTIELTGSWNIGYAVDVRPNAWGNAYTEPTTFVMNGGNIVSSDGAVRVASSSSDTYPDVAASFTMNDGKIDAAWDGVFIQQSDVVWDNLSFTMNGGTIESDLNPVRFYGPAATSYVSGEDCVDIALNGGTLTYTGTEEQTWIVDNILRIGGGATADEFLKDATVTASETFAQNNAAEGYTWVESDGVYTLKKVKLFNLKQITVSLDSSLALNIYYNLSDLTGEGYKAVIEHTKEDGSVVTTTIPYSEWVTSKTMIAVRYTGMAAKQMTDRIKITIYNADGTQASESYETSFRDYAVGSLKQYSKNDAYAKYLPVFIDMLNYGAAAQTKFGYNTDNLANADTDEFQEHATEEYIITDKNWQFDREHFYAITVSLENTLEFNAYFNEAKEGMYAKYSYTTHSGKQIEGKVEYDSFVSRWNHLGIAIPVAIADADALITVDLYDSDDTKLGTTVYSIDGYLKGMIEQGEPDEIYNALAKFAASAKAAFVKK